MPGRPISPRHQPQQSGRLHKQSVDSVWVEDIQFLGRESQSRSPKHSFANAVRHCQHHVDGAVAGSLSPRPTAGRDAVPRSGQRCDPERRDGHRRPHSGVERVERTGPAREHPGRRQRAGHVPAGVGSRHHRGDLTAYGFTTDQVNQLTNWAWGEITSNTDPTQIAIDLQSQPAFIQQFPGFAAANQELNAAGLPAVSVQNYQQYQTNAMAMAQAAGLALGVHQHAEHRHAHRRERLDPRNCLTGSTTP